MQILFFLINLSLSAGDTHILLIGISDYGHSELNLPSVENDLELVSAYFKETLPNAYQRRLLNEDATHQKVVEALTDLQRLSADDRVIIYYSGHGSQYRDENQDEYTDGLDESWVTYGSRRQEGLDGYDLLDDELGHALLSLQTEHILLIQDSCHSGSGSRALKPRNMQKDERSHPKGKLAYTGKFKGLRLTATSEAETAFPTEVDGQYYGRFTWHLIAALRDTMPGQSWQDLIRKIRYRIAAEAGRDVKAQTPGHEGDGFPLAWLVGGENSEVGSELVGQISRVSGGGKRVVLDVGALFGVSQGSIFENDRGTSLRVTKTGEERVRAHVVDGPIPEIGEVFGLTRYVRDIAARIRLGVVTDLSDDFWVNRIKQRLEAEFGDLITLTEPGQPAEWTLHIHRFDGLGQPRFLPASGNKGGMVIWVTDQEGLLHINRPFKLMDAHWEEEFDEKMRALVRRWDLLNLAASSDEDMPFSVELIPCVQKGTSMARIKEDAMELRHDRASSVVFKAFEPEDPGIFPPKTLLAFRLVNQGPSRYFYVIHLDISGKMNIHFPMKQDQDNAGLIAEGQGYTSLYENSIYLKRPGMGYVLVLSTLEPLNIGRLRVSNPFRDVDADKELPKNWYAKLWRFQVR